LIPTRLQRYVLRETVYVALLSALALTAIVFVGMSVSRVQRGLNVMQLRGLIGYIFAFSLPYALPSALLVASVFTFGRLSGANELTAIAGSGVRLSHVILPVAILALVVSAGTFWLNHYLLPWSLTNVKSQSDRLVKAVLKSVGEMRRVYPVGRYRIYVGGVDGTSGLWNTVAVIEFASDDFPSRIMIAEHAHCMVDEEREIARLTLFNGLTMTPQLGDIEGIGAQTSIGFGQMQLDISVESHPSSRPKYLQLPDLRKALRKYRTEAETIRATDPEIARVAHPKTERVFVERELNKTYRAWNKLKAELAERTEVATELRAEEETARLEYRARAAAHAVAAEAYDEVKKQVEGRERLRNELKVELTRLLNENAESEKLARANQEFRDACNAAAALTPALQRAEREVQEDERALKEAEEQLAAVTALLADAAEAEADAQARERNARESFERNQQKHAKIRTLEDVLRTETVLHFRNAGALTSLMFVLIGIPLGILARRGNVIVAFAISFFAVLMIYYPLMIVGRMLSLDGYVNPMIAQWMPNVVVGGIGIFLLARCIRR